MTNQFATFLIFHPLWVIAFDAALLSCIALISLSPRWRTILGSALVLAPLSPLFAVRLTALGIIVLCDLVVSPLGFAHKAAEKLVESFDL